MQSVAYRGWGTPPPLPHHLMRIVDRSWRWKPPQPPSFLPSEMAQTPKKAQKSRSTRRILQIHTFKHSCVETGFRNNIICSARSLHPIRWHFKIFQIAWKKVNLPTNIGHVIISTKVNCKNAKGLAYKRLQTSTNQNVDWRQNSSCTRMFCVCSLVTKSMM